ncbi:hypothetical protein KQX54_017401 [Cotesia glomerata]|uniref:Uncharacterized protein n=1 Tax=Cotesia glomerata TaxID=32391 RepID=A0AAV7IA98_COTGL|nr:hypothetical protein KQX54_017401 [Cotesia glomerata]
MISYSIASQPPRNKKGPIVSYGSITNSEGNTYINKNIRGSVTFDTPSPDPNGGNSEWIPMDLVHQEQPFQDRIPGDGRDIIPGSQTYQNGMTFNVDPVGPNMFGATDKGARNVGGPRRYQSGDTQPEINAQTEKKPQNNTESQAHSAKHNLSIRNKAIGVRGWNEVSEVGVQIEVSGVGVQNKVSEVGVQNEVSGVEVVGTKFLEFELATKFSELDQRTKLKFLELKLRTKFLELEAGTMLGFLALKLGTKFLELKLGTQL